MSHGSALDRGENGCFQPYLTLQVDACKPALIKSSQIPTNTRVNLTLANTSALPVIYCMSKKSWRNLHRNGIFLWFCVDHQSLRKVLATSENIGLLIMYRGCFLDSLCVPHCPFVSKAVLVLFFRSQSIEKYFKKKEHFLDNLSTFFFFNLSYKNPNWHLNVI